MTSGQPARSTTGAVAADHARLATAGTNALVATALRTKSLYAREIVAERAWPGHTPAELDGWAAQQPSGLEPEMDPRSLMDYARLVAVQVASQENRALARIILALAVGEAAEEDLKPNYVELLLNLHVVLGERTAALSLLNHPKVRSDVRASSEADLMNPWSHADQEPQAWFAAVERLMNTERLLPLTLMASDDPRRLGEDTLFDRLTVQGAEAVTAPAKVTIIMSAFKPGLQLLTAVRSAMAQTWSNIELLVIDDGSGPEYAATLDAAGALDSRVRVIRKAVNGGTYRARNTALRQLTGDFVMVLDSDDYLHPQAVEVLVRPLLKRDHLLATRAMGVRVSENLEFTRPGYRPRFTVATSLMFRFAGVVSRIGFFDTTYKGADTEYLRRMEAAFGPKRLRDISEVLTIVRGGDTLSAAEFSNGWRHGARHEYKSSYGPWHKQIATGLAVPFLDPDAPRQFTQPRRWNRPTRAGMGPARRYDVVFAGDWRRYGGPQRSMLEEIEAAKAAGLRVGIMHLEALRFMTTSDLPLCDAVLAKIAAGEVDWLQLDDDVDIDVLMIRYPPILQYPPYAARTVRAKHVLVMANQAPLEPDGSDQRYVVSDVTHRTAELFGSQPTWVPQSPHIRGVLQAQDPDVQLTDWDNPGLIDPAEWLARPARPMGDPIVIGRYSRDDRIKFGETFAEVLEGYAFGPGYEVRMMGAQATLKKLAALEEQTLDDLPDNWQLVPHRSMETLDFLRELDFFLYLDHADANEAFGRVILEAAASGVLTIVHPKHRSTFGDTVDYALPGQAQALIERYAADSVAYQERVERTLAEVRRRYGRAGFADRLASLTEPERSDSVAGGVRPGADMGRPSVTVEVSRSLTLPGTAELQFAGAPADFALVNIPVRRLADAELADSFTVVHTGSEQVVLKWASAQIVDFSRDDLALDLRSSAPPEAFAFLACRDGLATLMLRDDSVADGWSTKIYWLSDLPRMFTLS